MGSRLQVWRVPAHSSFHPQALVVAGQGSFAKPAVGSGKLAWATTGLLGWVEVCKLFAYPFCLCCLPNDPAVLSGSTPALLPNEAWSGWPFCLPYRRGCGIPRRSHIDGLLEGPQAWLTERRRIRYPVWGMSKRMCLPPLFRAASDGPIRWTSTACCTSPLPSPPLPPPLPANFWCRGYGSRPRSLTRPGPFARTRAVEPVRPVEPARAVQAVSP